MTDDAMHVEAPTSSGGIRFYSVVTLGNLLMIAASLVPILIWGILLEGRVDMDGVLRARLEKQVADRAAEMAKRNDRIEALLTKIAEDVTAVRIQLGMARRPSESSAHETYVPDSEFPSRSGEIHTTGASQTSGQPNAGSQLTFSAGTVG